MDNRAVQGCNSTNPCWFVTLPVLLLDARVWKAWGGRCMMKKGPGSNCKLKNARKSA